jgi:hypothetical protein
MQIIYLAHRAYSCEEGWAVAAKWERAKCLARSKGIRVGGASVREILDALAFYPQALVEIVGFHLLLKDYDGLQ